MSQAAEDIEEARRQYVKSMGTPSEAAARRYLEAVVERVKKQQGSEVRR